MENIANSSTYTIKKGDTLWKISRSTGKTVEELLELNPNTNPTGLQIGHQLILANTQQKPKNEFSVEKLCQSKSNLQTQANVENPRIQQENISSLEKYETNQEAAFINVKKSIKEAEGKSSQPYIEPDGKTAIAYGHKLINKPKFLLDIEELKIPRELKNKKLQESLQNPKNLEALKQALRKDLQEAIKTTGIKDVPATINNDLKLSDAQIELLLNSDIKKAENNMEKTFGRETLKQRTTQEKQVALDLFFNIGPALPKKAPKFTTYFKNGEIEKAQAQLDFFSVKNKNGTKKYKLGLIRRNYDRMLLINNNKLTSESKEKLLTAYNKYCLQNNKKPARSFNEIQKILED